MDPVKSCGGIFSFNLILMVGLLVSVHHSVVERHVLGVELFGIKIFWLLLVSLTVHVNVLCNGRLRTTSNQVNIMFSFALDVKSQDHVLLAFLCIFGMREKAVGANDVAFSVAREVLQGESYASRAIDGASAGFLGRGEVNNVRLVANGQTGHGGDQISDGCNATRL